MKARTENGQIKVYKSLPSEFVNDDGSVIINFKNAPTAKNANNFFGMHATGDQKFLETTGGAKLRSFDDSKASIRAFYNLMVSDERYKNVIESMDKVENMFPELQIL